jgi:hypothetical protein
MWDPQKSHKPIDIHGLLTGQFYFYFIIIIIVIIQGWCIANCMKLNITKTRFISFSRKTNVLKYDYKLCQCTIIRTDSIKYLGVYIDAKLHFHYHVNHIFSDCIKLLGLIRSITLHFSSLECMLRLYIALVRSKIE